jgi:hypothetical protein
MVVEHARFGAPFVLAPGPGTGARELNRPLP